MKGKDRQRQVLAAVLCTGVVGLPALPLLTGDPLAARTAPAMSVAFLLLAAATWTVRLPLRWVEASAWTLGTAALARQVAVVPPEDAAFHALAAITILATGAFYLWPRGVATPPSVVVAIAMTLHVGTVSDLATMAVTALYGFGVVMLCGMRATTAEQLAEQRELALSDDLTGLPNRRAMMIHLRASLARRAEGAPADALLMVDVDHFKAVNDTHGHDVGDEVLRTIAATVDRVVAGRGVAARWGGEEFLVLLEAAGAAEVHAFGEVLRDAVTCDSGMTVSVGVASADVVGGTVRAWIASADHAMYLAKAGGRDRVVMDSVDASPAVRASSPAGAGAAVAALARMAAQR